MLAPLMTSWAVMAVGAVGVLAGVRGFWWDRSRGRPRCPRCWYLMIGAPSPRCPECGHVASRPKDLHRTRRSRTLMVLGALLMPGLPAGLIWPYGDRIVDALRPRYLRLQGLPLGRYSVVRESDRLEGGTRVRILLDGRDRIALHGWRLMLGGQCRDGTRTVGVGDDITGDGVPDLIVHDFSGGAHCCSTYYVFELNTSSGPLPLATLYGEHGGFAFEDLDGDGAVECIGADWTFAYWNTCYASSPAPEVILRFRAGRYVIAADLMRTAPPAECDLAERARLILEDPESVDLWMGGSVPPAYWAVLLNLIYHGHEPLAWRFADQAWPDGRPGKDAFLDAFRAQLGRSPYWPDVRTVSFGE